MKHLRRRLRSTGVTIRKFANNNRSLVFIAVFATVGATFIVFSHAASPSIAIEPESASLTTPAVAVADTTASGGSAVKFNAPGSGTQGVAACDPSKGLADEHCWWANTGVLNDTTTNPYDRWTEAQIKTGQSNLAHVTGPQVLDQANDFSSGNGTVGNPWIYEKKWITGCLEINVSNVIIQNVLVDWSDQSTACYINPTNPQAKVTAGVTSGQRTGVVLRDIEIDVGPPSSSPCAAYPWPTNCPDVFIENMGSGLLLCGLGTGNGCSGGFIVQRANIHGGSTMVGRTGGTKIEDSYIHDAGRMHKSCYNDPVCDDYHVESIFAQGQSNWSVTHSFLNIWHYNNMGTGGDGQGSSGACLCNDISSNWAIINSYLNGGDGFPNGGAAWQFSNGNGLGSKIVMQNVYYANGRIGTSAEVSDYSAGAWTPSFDTNGLPQIDHSRCTNLYKVSAQGSITKTDC